MANLNCYEEHLIMQEETKENLKTLSVFLEKQGHKNNPDYFHLRIDRSS